MAQTITVANESSLPRVDASGNELAKRSIAENPERVDGPDCIDDQRIRFTLFLSDYATSGSVQAWASSSGLDCSVALNRSGSTQQCWRLVDAPIPLTPQQNVDIAVRRIMSGLTPFSPSIPDATSNACGKVGLSTAGVQFLYFDPGNVSSAAVNHTTAITVDTINPPDGTLADGGTGTGTANGVGCNTTGAVPPPPRRLCSGWPWPPSSVADAADTLSGGACRRREACHLGPGEREKDARFSLSPRQCAAGTGYAPSQFARWLFLAPPPADSYRFCSSCSR